MKRKAICYVLAVMLFIIPNVARAKQAGDMTGPIVLTAVYVLYLRDQLQKLDNYGGPETANMAKRTTGEIYDNQANHIVSNVAVRLQEAYAAQGDSRSFIFWVNPRNNFNAACFLGRNITVNIGALQLLQYNEDMVAMLLGHEMAHGKNRHILNGV